MIREKRNKERGILSRVLCWEGQSGRSRGFREGETDVPRAVEREREASCFFCPPVIYYLSR